MCLLSAFFIIPFYFIFFTKALIILHISASALLDYGKNRSACGVENHKQTGVGFSAFQTNQFSKSLELIVHLEKKKWVEIVPRTCSSLYFVSAHVYL